jgi:hypothetical protein
MQTSSVIPGGVNALSLGRRFRIGWRNETISSSCALRRGVTPRVPYGGVAPSVDCVPGEVAAGRVSVYFGVNFCSAPTEPGGTTLMPGSTFGG